MAPPGVAALVRRVAALEEQLAELTKRFEEFAARPVHDPFRPIGPGPGQWIGTPGDEVIWPPATRHL